MQDLIISLNKNVVRISTVDKDTVLRTTLVDVPRETVDDTKILNSSSFSQILSGLLPQITTLTKNKMSLNFVVEPQDVYLRFITLPKKDGNLDDQIINELKEKAKDVPLDDLYFSYVKIAPFVYQFAGVKKDFLDKYLEVSNHLGIGLKSVTPWVLALPKYEKVCDPAIFISKVGNRQVIALSELNGIFFSDVYENEKTEKELQDLVKELSFYKRSSPIKHVFTMNCDYLSLGDYEVKEIEYPVFKDNLEVASGYEQNVIVNYLLDTDTDVVSNQLNLLNLLPLPVVESRSVPAIATGVVFASLILIGGLFGGYIYLRGKNQANVAQLAQNTQDQEQSQNTQVLSEATQNLEQTQENAQPKKEDLKIRVENGAGVSGLAARTKEFLVGLGYTVLDPPGTSSISTEATILEYKKEAFDTYNDMVIADIKEKLPNTEVKQTLSSDKEYDLLLTVGSSSKIQ
ncbi:MAG: LytR C-terminal domain-containing protein [Patescibacteria group bacterium]